MLCSEKMFLDWDRYAITGSPGHFLTERKTARVAIKKTMHPPPCFVYPIYLVQSKKHFCKLHIAPHTCPNLQSIFQFSLFLPSFLMETLLWWLRNHLYSWGNYPFNCLIKVFTRHICSIKARILTVQQVLLIKKSVMTVQYLQKNAYLYNFSDTCQLSGLYWKEPLDQFQKLKSPLIATSIGFFLCFLSKPLCPLQRPLERPFWRPSNCPNLRCAIPIYEVYR